MKLRYFLITVFLFAPLLSLAESPSDARLDPRTKYQNGEIVEILIVPGHDDKHSGAVFRGQREADMNLMLAKKIAAELANDPNIFVTVTRDDAGYYPPLQEYFDENEKEINKFIKDNKAKTRRLMEAEDWTIDPGVTHNDALPEVAYALYGINKWIAEESFDLVIHIHFNDDTSHWGNNMGEYGGYTIYVPDENLPNAKGSKPLAESIGREMQKTFNMSNLPLEADRSDEFGLVPDFKLIALGSNRTLATPSILVEYSYIYEPHVAAEFLDLSTKVMSRATALGVYNLLGGVSEWRNLTHSWTKLMKLSTKKDVDVLALQYGLKELGYYPPKNHHRDNCPFSGLYGPCTQKAVKAFQKANALKDDGVAGPKTLGAMNSIFGF